MILPTKHITQERALLSVGARLLKLLERPKTVSAVWEEVRLFEPPISYAWFILALDLLYILDAVEFSHGLLKIRIPK